MLLQRYLVSTHSLPCDLQCTFCPFGDIILRFADCRLLLEHSSRSGCGCAAMQQPQQLGEAMPMRLITGVAGDPADSLEAAGLVRQDQAPYMGS